jgi:hypothetical protein
VLLVGGASLATAQNGPPTGGQLPVAGGAGGGWYPGYGYGYGYAGAPLYDYAAPAYGYAAPAYSAPAAAGTTVVIITPAPAYTAPVVSGYYAAPSTVVSPDICLRNRIWVWLHTRLLEPRLLGPVRVWLALKPLTER